MFQSERGSGVDACRGGFTAEEGSTSVVEGPTVAGQCSYAPTVGERLREDRVTHRVDKMLPEGPRCREHESPQLAPVCARCSHRGGLHPPEFLSPAKWC